MAAMTDIVDPEVVMAVLWFLMGACAGSATVLTWWIRETKGDLQMLREVLRSLDERKEK